MDRHKGEWPLGHSGSIQLCTVTRYSEGVPKPPAILLLLLASATPAPAAPPVWMGPPGTNGGQCLRALFDHPDQWRETRKLIDVLFYTDLNFNKQFRDDELRA